MVKNEFRATMALQLEELGRRIAELESRLERPASLEEVRPPEALPALGFIEAASFAVAVDRDSKLKYVNRAGASMLGYELRAPLIGRSIPDLLHPDERASWRARRKRIADDEVLTDTVERRLIHREGHPVYAYGGAVRVRHTGGFLIVSMYVDVTPYKQVEQELRASEERYRALAENAYDPVVELDEQGRAVYLNPSFERQLGYPLDELYALWGDRDGPSILLHPDDRERIQSALDKLVAGQSVTGFIYRVRHRDGTYRWLESTGRPFRTAAGAIHVAVVSRDITERRRADEERIRHAETLEAEVARRTAELERANRTLRRLQQDLIRSERLGAAEDLAGRVVHAINSPLTALLGTVDLALEERPEDRTLARVQRLAQRVAGVVDRTLQLFRMGSLDLALVSPADVLRDVLAEIEAPARKAGVHVEVKSDGELPEIHVDRTLLASALVSIAENALEAMPDGGELFFEVEALRDAGVVVFRIADTGPGIPDELRDRVFEPFFTTRGGGSGIGLSIAKGVVEGHRGRIRIAHPRRGGASVSVEIPAGPVDEPYQRSG
jgi:PAS domain S-box-containing protein